MRATQEPSFCARSKLSPGRAKLYCFDPFGNKLCFVAADTLFTAGLLN
jgi:hypothetical protein